MKDLGAWRFEDFLLDCVRGELRRDDQPLALSPKEFETLQMLVENAGRLVSKDDLVARVWPNSFVGDGSLARNISALRRVLGPVLIQTVARRGYRFVPAATWEPSPPTSAKVIAIEIVPEPAVPESPIIGSEEHRAGPIHNGAPVFGEGFPQQQLDKRWRERRGIRFVLVLAASLAVAAAILVWSQSRVRGNSKKPVRIAVLPFVNLTGDPNQEYLCDGLTEAMIAELSRLSPGSLGVIARTSAMHYKGTTEAIPQIGRELGVDYVLESSVRGSAERARITAQLVRASDATHQWTGEYERDLKDIMSVQQEVAMGIASEIRLNLNAETTARLRQSHPVDPEAYRYYLLGQFYWNKRDRQSLLTARDYFQKAVDRDPQFAQGWAGLANGYLLLANFGPPILPPLAEGRKAVQRALELDEDLASAHTALAYLKMVVDWDWAGAEVDYKRALELDPNDANAHHWYALYLIGMKRPQEAIREIRRAMELDPLSLGIAYNGGFIYMLAGQRQEADRLLRRALEIDPNSAVAHGLLGIVYQRNRHYASSLSEFKTAERLSGGPVPYLAGVASVEALSGNFAAARKDLDELLKLHEKHLLAASSLAFVYAGLGDNDNALQWLSKAVEERSVSVVEINNDALFDGFRNDSRFLAIQRRMRLAP
jgi:TolB-like protein/DNA-binding winged helix-turn-helix (wHTH) protein/Tfp pilus assembly protein PilF